MRAARLHARQQRKGSQTPYIAPLLAVTAIALDHGATEQEAIAALSHDAVEDQGSEATRAQIRQDFGDDVADIVQGCTDAQGTPKPPWELRKKQFIAGLRQASPSILLVAAADKLHNARSVLADYQRLGEALWPRFTGDRAGTLWYYRAVTDALRAAASADDPGCCR